MTVRIAQFVHTTHDVVDEAFLREFPEVEAVKANNLETLSNALEGAEIFQVYNSAFTPEFARLVRDKGRALKWIQFTTVGIDIALKAGLPEGVRITISGHVSRIAGPRVNLYICCCWIEIPNLTDSSEIPGAQNATLAGDRSGIRL
jgi:hypothetical protein